MSRRFNGALDVLQAVVMLVLLAAGTPAAAEQPGGADRIQVAQATPPPDPALVEKVRQANAQCFTCHTGAALAHPPRQDMDMEKLKLFLVDPQAYEHSNHGGVDCKNCHGQGYVPFPHRPEARTQTSQCSECHAQKVLRLEPQFDKSVHAQELPGKFTCQTCHDPHKYQVARKTGDPREIVAQDNAMCLDCHSSDKAFHKLAKPDTERPDIDRIHNWLPNQQLHWKAVRCVDCHTPASTMKQLALSHEILSKDRAEKDCVACHSTNSALRTRLYRHLVDQEVQTAGFTNSIILRSAYVVGATRNTYLDIGGLALVGLTVAGVFGHGFIRILTGTWRRWRRHD
jgi:hypothetical protein